MSVSFASSLPPIPVPNADNAGFWEGCRQRELRLQCCAQCGSIRHPPRPMCPRCQCPEAEWRRASGRGTLYTFTIVYAPTLAAFQSEIPYNVVVVHLEEGPFIVTNLVDYNADQIAIGMPVEVVFEDVGDTVTLPKFRPAATEP
jgi:uncharacterized OB-fold protein